MNDQSPKYNQATLKVSLNATSSQESGGGAQQLDLLGGGTTDKCGQVARHANHSAQPENGKDKTMSDTCGQYSSISYASAALQSSLESRLQQRLEQAGSMIYKMTWKQKVTPRQWSYCQRAASVPRTKETDSGRLHSGWTTPTLDDTNQRTKKYAQGGSSLSYQTSQIQAGSAWPTPQHSDNVIKRTSKKWKAKGSINMSLSNPELAPMVTTCWPTPMQTDGSKACNRYRENRQNGLGAIASLADPWATPTTRDYKNTGNLENYIFGSPTGRVRTDSVSTQAFLVDSGIIPDLSGVEMTNIGQYPLNPRFSLWLMGYPIEWAYCGERVTLSSRKSRQKS
jgi:hypothetical protein